MAALKLPPDVDVSKAHGNHGKITQKMVPVTVNNVTTQEMRNVYEVQAGKPIPADLIVHADRGDLESAGYNVKENGIPICHSHLGLKKDVGVQGMIADPVKLGQMMHLVAQNHLLNAKHFKHNEYVEEVTRKQLVVSQAKQQEVASDIQGHLIASAEMGECTVVTPEAQKICFDADFARHQTYVEKHGGRKALSLTMSGQPHLVNLAAGINYALATIGHTLADGGAGTPGHKVADFDVDQSVTEALNNFGVVNPPHAAKAASQQVVIGSNGQTITLKNPYAHTSQEFLRHHLLRSFEGTMKRKEAVDARCRKLNAIVAAAPDKADKAKARALSVRLQEVNAAATGAILCHIRPGEYKRHGEMADLHKEALSILSDTHSAQRPPKKQGTPPPALTSDEAELDRAKAKVAYHVMKHLADDVHFEVPSRKRTEAQIKTDRENKITAAKNLLMAYKNAYQNPKDVVDLAKNLPDPEPLPKKK